MATPVTLIPGDGIGPAVTEAAVAAIEATGVDIQWIEALAGMTAFEEKGDPLPASTLESVAHTRVALKGPCTTGVRGGFRSVNVHLRKEFSLYANVRPSRGLPGVDCLYPGLDLVVIRENTEGLYSNMEHWVDDQKSAAIAIGINTRSAMERIVRYAFEYASSRGRRKVTVVHKANILKLLTGLILEIAETMSSEYPDLEFDDRIVDNMAMQLVMNPSQFDVIVTTNLFGDILSDLCAGLIGGLGLAPGANIGGDMGIFEAVHGTAPDIAGKDLANPTSVILAGVMMLEHMGHLDEAKRLEAAVLSVLEEGKYVTRDINPTNGVGTKAMTQAIVDRVKS